MKLVGTDAIELIERCLKTAFREAASRARDYDSFVKLFCKYLD